jgi:hypothetical protein
MIGKERGKHGPGARCLLDRSGIASATKDLGKSIKAARS